MKAGWLAFFLCAAGVQAGTQVWLGGDGAYATPGQWNNAVVPSAGDDVVISNGAVTVTAADTFAGLASVTLGEGGALVCNENVETQADVIFGGGNTLTVTAGDDAGTVFDLQPGMVLGEAQAPGTPGAPTAP